MTVHDIYAELARRQMPQDHQGLIIDPDTNVASFLLYNLSGQIVGYHQYNPQGEKKARGKDVGRYYTYSGKEGTTSKIAVWGMETYDMGSTVLFVTEGVFDANRIHRCGFPAIAILSNNSRILRSWLRSIPQTVIAILDNDAAGKMLAKTNKLSAVVPDPYKDLDEMPQPEVWQFLHGVLRNLH